MQNLIIYKASAGSGKTYKLTEEYLRLALLCVEVERLAAIDGVLVKARAVLAEARNGSKKTDAAVTPDRPEAATAVDPSWPPVKGASFAVEVKTRLDGKVVDDPAKRAVLVKYLKECAGGYVVRTLDSVRKPDYVIQVGIAVTQGKERDMYGGMPISREWEASCLCRVRAAESGKELYRFELPVLRESASAHLKDAAELTAKNASNRFISRLQTTPPFQQASPQSEPAKPQAARSRS